jgi:hypothetical protein
MWICHTTSSRSRFQQTLLCRRDKLLLYQAKCCHNHKMVDSRWLLRVLVVSVWLQFTKNKLMLVSWLVTPFWSLSRTELTRNVASSGIERHAVCWQSTFRTRASRSVAKNSDHYTTEAILQTTTLWLTWRWEFQILKLIVSGFAGLENRWPHDTLYPQKLALTSPTSSGRSVGIVLSRTKATELYTVKLV